MSERIDSETENLTRHINIENKIREESSRKLENLITETFETLVEQLMQEKAERKENSDGILRLLEDTCNKLDKKFSYY